MYYDRFYVGILIGKTKIRGYQAAKQYIIMQFNWVNDIDIVALSSSPTVFTDGTGL